MKWKKTPTSDNYISNRFPDTTVLYFVCSFSKNKSPEKNPKKNTTLI